MSNHGKPPVHVIKATQQQESDVWDLPNVQKETDELEKPKTNVFGKKSDWVFEPPEEEVAEPTPLTAEEIDKICTAASEEGFNQGKEEGFSAGFEEGKIKGIEEGNIQGLEEGNAQGLLEGKEVIEQLAGNWKGLIEQLHSPMATVEKNVEEQLLNLVVQLTEAVVLQEAKTNPDILMAAITTGIKSLPSSEPQTQIYLHPDEIKMVEEQFGADYINESGWRLLPAPQLSPGSCQIENSTSNIDLQIKNRLKQVLEPFLLDSIHQEE